MDPEPKICISKVWVQLSSALNRDLCETEVAARVQGLPRCDGQPREPVAGSGQGAHRRQSLFR
jgi:hypothetical protein